MDNRSAKRKKGRRPGSEGSRPSAPEIDIESLDEHSKRIVSVRTVMNERDEARKAGNFLKSDELRDKLKDMGVFVVDQKDGRSGWKFLDGSSNKLAPGTKIPEQATKKKRKEVEDPPESSHTATSKSKKQRREEAKSDISSETTRNLALLKKAKAATAEKTAPGSRIVEGVGIVDVDVGSGAEATSGSRVSVHYVGKLKTTKKVFDASTKKPFQFKLGLGEVIRGWDVGVQGMRIGGRRTLTIPPEKAYGRHGAPPTIPGNATLIFDVRLLGVK